MALALGSDLSDLPRGLLCGWLVTVGGQWAHLNLNMLVPPKNTFSFIPLSMKFPDNPILWSFHLGSESESRIDRPKVTISAFRAGDCLCVRLCHAGSPGGVGGHEDREISRESGPTFLPCLML